MQPKNFSLPEKFQKARKYEKNEEIMRMSEMGKDKTPNFALSAQSGRFKELRI